MDARRWQVEAPLELAGAIAVAGAHGDVVLVDCLTLWLSNLILAERDIAAAKAELAGTLVAGDGTVILVSNEVGQGIVPDNELARRFRDEAGWLHQELAAIVEEVWFVTAWLAQRLK